ncbi:hypothetical protein [Nocardia sp. CA-145437]|uniref:hypothetical protein n=1 Tax=Nocardia sp. CA-145437 TaxID=3239980 RepID=UPI003D996C3D
MNTDELRSIEEKLRAAIIRTPLEWVLDEVDAAVVAGVQEEKVLRRRRTRNRDRSTPDLEANSYEVVDRSSVTGAEYAASRQRGTLVITTRPMTDSERVEHLLEALRRVFVELPAIESEALTVLQTVPSTEPGVRGEVDGVAFEPEEAPRQRHRRRDLSSQPLAASRRERLDGLFATVTGEVRS